MMLDFKMCIEKYDIKPKGLIQLGVHLFQEKPVFVGCGIKNFVLVEPQKLVFSKLEALTQDVNAILFNCAVSNYIGQTEMKVDNNNGGESASLLAPKVHKDKYPHIGFDKRELVEVKQIKDLDFNHLNYNILVMDLQGGEIDALMGAGNLLRHIDCIYTEVNFEEMYERCALIGELDSFLFMYNFKRVETGPNYNNQGWSDAFYVKM